MDDMDNIVKLDVGGVLYTTLRSTLTPYPESMLGGMFSGRIPTVRCDATGHYVIDGDGTIFRYVLNFLRRSKLNLPEDFKEWDLLSTEADFYQIKELIDAVKSLEKGKTPVSTVQEMEFIEITESHPGKITYIGSGEILEEIPLLVDALYRHGYSNQSRSNVLMTVKTHGMIDSVNSSGYGINFSEHRMDIFQQISKVGFELTSTSSAGGTSEESYPQFREWLFARKITPASNEMI